MDEKALEVLFSFRDYANYKLERNVKSIKHENYYDSILTNKNVITGTCNQFIEFLLTFPRYIDSQGINEANKTFNINTVFNNKDTFNRAVYLTRNLLNNCYFKGVDPLNFDTEIYILQENPLFLNFKNVKGVITNFKISEKNLKKSKEFTHCVYLVPSKEMIKKNLKSNLEKFIKKYYNFK